MSSFSKTTSCCLMGVVLLISVMASVLASGATFWWMSRNVDFSRKTVGTVSSDIGSLEQTINVDENSAVVDVAEKVNPVVVSITSTEKGWDWLGKMYSLEGGGSGFIISQDGLILTNKHVVSDNSVTYSVITDDGTKYDGKVMSVDPMNDLAIVKIDASDLPYAVLGDSDSLKVGQRLVAIGNALNEYQNTVTTGIVSAVDRSILAGDGLDQSEQLENMIQTDAAINPGNSGGPLVDLGGAVIGINTAIDTEASNIGFAIPINQAKSAIESYLTNGRIIRPRLGVRFVSLTPELAATNQMEIKYGALIYSDSFASLAVIPGTAADKAGLQVNDIIVSVNSEMIDERHSLLGILQKYKPGDEIEIEYWRKGELQKTKVILDEMK
ncbi:MAG TPA: trypsin-like peptidase domain-containing protein [bacterium]|nr:trypsin-like peptidase domain-containing protein [bacterium]